MELVSNQPSQPIAVADEELEAVLDELRLDPARYRRLLDSALLAALALEAAGAAGADASSWAQQAALDEERRHLGLFEPEDVAGWLEERGLRHDDLEAIARRLAARRWALDARSHSVAGELALALRLDDAYTALADRAARKREALASLPAADFAATDDEQVVSWYFHERLGQEVPVVLESWASAHGWRRLADLVRALRAEWRFAHRPA